MSVKKNKKKCGNGHDLKPEESTSNSGPPGGMSVRPNDEETKQSGTWTCDYKKRGRKRPGDLAKRGKGIWIIRPLCDKGNRGRQKGTTLEGL